MQRVREASTQGHWNTRIKGLAFKELVQVIEPMPFPSRLGSRPVSNSRRALPALSPSRNGSERCSTLGQDEDAFDVRCRSQSNANGIPSLRSQAFSIKPELTHVNTPQP